MVRDAKRRTSAGGVHEPDATAVRQRQPSASIINNTAYPRIVASESSIKSAFSLSLAVGPTPAEPSQESEISFPRLNLAGFPKTHVNKWLILRATVVHGYGQVARRGKAGNVVRINKALIYGWDSVIAVKEKGTAHMRNAMQKFRSARSGVFTASALAFGLALSPLTAPAAWAQALQSNIQEVQTAQAEGVAAQERINQIDDQTAQLESEYKAVLQQLDTLRQYNAQLEGLVNAQEAEIVVIQRDIDRVTTIDREVVPLMLQMVDSLDDYVEMDVPFLIDERRNRVANLRRLMQRADASAAEKFRRVLEAYQIENEYGRTIEGIRGNVQRDGRSLTVDFLRVGRVALYYKTLDDSEIARWNKASKNWETIDSGFVAPVKAALAIAREQSAPDLLLLPLDTPENAQ